MIVIYIIVVVIGSFICALLKTMIDEFEDSSMKRQSRLSLRRRNHSNNPQGTFSDPIEISDDDSIDLSLNIRKSTKEYTNVTSHGTTFLNSVTNVSKYNLKHDMSDDLSSNEDIALDDNNTSYKSPSMFNWDKPIFVTNPTYQNTFPECNVSHEYSCSRGEIIESSNKRRKLRNDSISLNSDYNDDQSSIELINYLEKDDSPSQVRIQYDIMIAGTKVKFPVKPYPCQIAVMNSLIQGCTKEGNCLLESPTGSGKTLALLCGALAWQEQYEEKIFQEKNEMDSESLYYDDDDAVDNFFLNASQYFDEELRDKVLSKKKTRRVPKIYYCTRTHRQIDQTIKEHKKTAYKHTRMTILSSRERTCIQKTNKNKDKLCNELIDSKLKVKNCKYYNEHIKQKSTIFSQMKTPWDIEELVSVGEKFKTCPYFGSKSLIADAEIIFCPYNYVLNPRIRESMEINLRGNIVIFDEAHNIEDTCREAADVILKDYKIVIAVKECQYLLDKNYKRDIYTSIHNYLTDVITFLKDIEIDCNNIGEMVSNNWVGAEFREVLHLNNIGCDRFSDFINACTVAIEDFKKMKEEKLENIVPTISQETKKLLESLCFAMQMIALDNYVNDYRMYIIETNELIEEKEDRLFSWTIKNLTKVRTMMLKCMNPAIIFTSVARDARSVILASGTLAPNISFQSELGTKFPYTVSPDHVVPKNQMYVRYITQGPNKKPLRATYNMVNTYDFQDELGNLILEVCDAVPYGILCFFSSYIVMNNIHDRWKRTGMWSKLSNLKKTFVEPKNDKDLCLVMEEYRSEIKKSSQSKSYRKAGGAILFAVFRAKVAEGTDFSDNEARCVLAIGIPYLKKNLDVCMKMKYNDNSNESRHLLSSNDWYIVNAFRALNQAIGRCVRHKNDWGAVLLVDERFEKQANIGFLPKWIKTNIKSNINYDLVIELQQFVVMQLAREKELKKKEKNKETRDFLLDDTTQFVY